MTRVGLELLAASLVSAAAVWFTLFTLIPAVARARFVLRMAELHDTCEDAVLDKLLPAEDPCVAEFLSRTVLFSRASRGFTLANVSCAYLTVQELGVEIDEEQFSYADLSSDARRLMHEMEDQLAAAARRLLLTGSASGWVLGGIFHAAKAAHALKNVRSHAPSTRRLLLDYEEFALNAEAASQRDARMLGFASIS